MCILVNECQRVVLSSMVLLLCLTSFGAAASLYDNATPMQGGPTASLPAEISVGELTFGAALDESSATAGELFTLYGASHSPRGHGGIGSYWDMVWAYAALCHKQLGYVPQTLTPQVLAQAYGCDVSELGAASRDGLRSPITGQFPELTSRDFKRGCFYIKVLSEEEKRLIGTRIPQFRKLWFEGIDENQNTGETREVECGPVFYVRVYGETDTVLEQLRFSLN